MRHRLISGLAAGFALLAAGAVAERAGALAPWREELQRSVVPERSLRAARGNTEVTSSPFVQPPYLWDAALPVGAAVELGPLLPATVGIAPGLLSEVSLRLRLGESSEALRLVLEWDADAGSNEMELILFDPLDRPVGSWQGPRGTSSLDVPAGTYRLELSLSGRPGPRLRLRASVAALQDGLRIPPAVPGVRASPDPIPALHLELSHGAEHAWRWLLATSAARLASGNGAPIATPNVPVRAAVRHPDGRASVVSLTQSGVGDPRHFDERAPSFTVRVLSGPLIRGMSQFKLYSLATKDGLLDYVIGSLIRDEGLFVPRWLLVRTAFNGRSLGLYVLEETPSPGFFDGLRRSSGALQSVGWHIYGPEPETAGDGDLADAMPRINGERMARALALAARFQATHALQGSDLRFHLDPIRRRWEPVIRDINADQWPVFGLGERSFLTHTHWWLAPRPLGAGTHYNPKVWPGNRAMNGELGWTGTYVMTDTTLGLSSVNPWVVGFLADPARRLRFEQYLIYAADPALWRRLHHRLLNTLSVAAPHLGSYEPPLRHQAESVARADMVVPRALPALIARGRVLVQPEPVDVRRGTRTALVYNLAPLSGRLVLPHWVRALPLADPDSSEILVAPAPLAVAVFRADFQQQPRFHLNNGSFESWARAESGTVPEGWQYFQGGVRGRIEPVVEPDDVREGRRALRIHPSSQGPSYVRFRLSAEGLRGGWALLRVWAKSANTTSGAVQIDLQTDDGDIAVGSYSNSGSWQPLEVRKWIPVNAKNLLVTVNAAARASAPAIFDDASLLVEQHSLLPVPASALSRLVAIEGVRDLDFRNGKERTRPTPIVRIEVPVERWSEFVEYLRGGAWRWADVAPATADQVEVLPEVAASVMPAGDEAREPRADSTNGCSNLVAGLLQEVAPVPGAIRLQYLLVNQSRHVVNFHLDQPRIAVRYLPSPQWLYRAGTAEPLGQFRELWGSATARTPDGVRHSQSFRLGPTRRNATCPSMLWTSVVDSVLAGPERPDLPNAAVLEVMVPSQGGHAALRSVPTAWLDALRPIPDGLRVVLHEPFVVYVPPRAALVARRVVETSPSPPLRIGPGEHLFSRVVVVPPGRRLEISPGAVLRFTPHAGILSHGPIVALGSAEQPIRFLPQVDGGSWRGLAIADAKGTSRLAHVIVEGAAGGEMGGYRFSGGLSVVRSRLMLRDADLRRIPAEDALHFSHSRYDLDRVRVHDTRGDALDSDWSVGTIRASRFAGCGRLDGGSARADCLDFSGSRAIVADTAVVDSSDKGVSVGEGSIVQLQGVEAAGHRIGFAVKDQSWAIARGGTLRGNGIGAAVYVKNPGFAYPAFTLHEVQLEGNGTAVHREPETTWTNRFN